MFTFLFTEFLGNTSALWGLADRCLILKLYFWVMHDLFLLHFCARTHIYANDPVFTIANNIFLVTAQLLWRILPLLQYVHNLRAFIYRIDRR